MKNISFQNTRNIELNIADLENGIYPLQLITLKNTFNIKIIKNEIIKFNFNYKNI